MKVCLNLIGFFLLLLVGTSLPTSFGHAAAAKPHSTKGKVELQPIVVDHLNRVLSDSSDLHEALIGGDEKMIQVQLIVLEKTVGTAVSVNREMAGGDNRTLRYAPSREKYLTELLTGIGGQLKVAKGKKKTERTPYLLEVYKRLVQLTKTFQLKTIHKIFFCAKDRSVWLQRGSRARNPFSLTSCGRAVVR